MRLLKPSGTKYFSLTMLFLLTFIGNSFAETTIKNPLVNNTPKFDVKAANKTFDRLNLKLSTQGLDPTTLKNAVKNLKVLLDSSDECVRINEKKISSIDSQIQESTQSSDNINTTHQEINQSKSSADLLYLTNERKILADQLSHCRLFSIRAKEALEVYESTLNKIKKEKILAKGKPIWEIIEYVSSNNILKTNIPADSFNLPKQILLPKNLYVMLATSFILAATIFYKSYTSKRIRRYINLKKIYLKSFILLTLAISASTITAYLAFIAYKLHAENYLLTYLSLLISIYLITLFTIVVTFNVKRIKAFFYWYSLDGELFKYLAIFASTLYILTVITKSLANTLNINPLLWELIKSLLLYIELLITIGFILYFCHAHRQMAFIKKYQTPIKLISSLMFIAFAVVNILGYHTLSFHLTFSGITTFAIIFIAILFEQAISKLYAIFINDGPTHNKLLSFFGYKKGQTLTEIFILKVTLQIIIFLYATYLISKNWGFANIYVENTFKALLNGIKFETFTFHPARIISGIIVFCVLYLIFRSISTAISRHEQFDGEEETQVAVASIFTYIGFAVAIVSALLVSGFDFTGLAIVAGALSVGIGLGLQSIVNNFVSGLIILIEKPIKPGDRINIDGIEGYVKKIRVRSTQILTTTREDMIIPNSDLITHRVTNYMFSDKHLTIFCEVGIGYGSDIELARNLLLDIANKHSEVITTIKNNKPRVFFRSFGENSMLFQVWMLIRDGNKKVAVRSEMYFAIEKAFRENNITIAYPQRDVHIKLSDIEALTENK